MEHLNSIALCTPYGTSQSNQPPAYKTLCFQSADGEKVPLVSNCHAWIPSQTITPTTVCVICTICAKISTLRPSLPGSKIITLPAYEHSYPTECKAEQCPRVQRKLRQ